MPTYLNFDGQWKLIVKLFNKIQNDIDRHEKEILFKKLSKTKDNTPLEPTDTTEPLQDTE